MNIGDCFVERRKNRGYDDQFVLSRVVRFKKLCVIEEIVIGADKLPYEYLDLLIRRRSPSKLSSLKNFSPIKFEQVYSAIKSLSKECKQLIDSNSKPVNNHKTTVGDVYCQNGHMELVINYVHFYRPSWNVDFISFSENNFSSSHYKFGVDVDKYNANPDSWFLTEEFVYHSIRERHLSFIERLRMEITSII